jgi:predicted nucleotidyltransferase
MFELRQPGTFPLCADPSYELEALKLISALTEAVSREIGGFDPLGIILTGSFARGEGTLIGEGQDGLRWLSDIESLVVFPDERRADAAAIGSTLARVASVLAADSAGLKIQLSPTYVSRIVAMRPAIFTCELFEHGKLLWGKGECIRARSVPTSAIPPADGFRLLNNRIVEKLPIRARLESPLLEPIEAWYTLSKFWLDLGTSLLVFLDCYRPSYRERCELVESTLASNPGIFEPAMAERAVQRVREAAEMKRGRMVPRESDLASCFVEAAKAAEQVWEWESLQLLGVTDDGHGWARIPRRLRRIESTRQRARDWARLLLRTRKSQKLGARALPAVLRAGSFGSAIYGAACLLDFYWHQIGPSAQSCAPILRMIGGLLGAEVKGCNGRWEATRRLFRAWEQHLRNAAL